MFFIRLMFNPADFPGRCRSYCLVVVGQGLFEEHAALPVRLGAIHRHQPNRGIAVLQGIAQHLDRLWTTLFRQGPNALSTNVRDVIGQRGAKSRLCRRVRTVIAAGEGGQGLQAGIGIRRFRLVQNRRQTPSLVLGRFSVRRR